jgi:F0F1-type ATP synthase assembly protein I
MASDDDGWIARSARLLQENITRSGPVAAASYVLVAAILGLGGLGFVLDRWLGSEPWLLLAGLALGIVVGFYELVKAAGAR